MSDFARSARITELYTKSLHWSESRIESYYDDKLSFIALPIAFERYLNGYIVATLNKINYVQITTGDRFVYKNADELAWTAYNELSSVASTASFNIETPLYRSLHNDNKEYLEIRTPNKEIGFSFTSIMINENNQSSVLESMLLNWIDDVAACLKLVKPIAEKYKIGIPKGLFNPNNYLKDSSGNAYFTNLEEDWTVPTNANFSSPADAFFSKIRSNKISHPFAVGNIDELTERARALWI